MTDTIGWGDVDAPPRRLPRLRLNRRRRVALVAVAALVAGGIAGWPSFKAWRADDAARQVQHLWARAQGLDNARVAALAGVQRGLGILDRPAFARAVALIEGEEAADLDRLVRQAKSVRTWTADVAAARKAVVHAMVAQATALRTQAGQPDAIGVDLPVTTAVDESTALDTAMAQVDGLRQRHHLKAFAPTTERFHSATEVLTTLRRPTDQPLHLRLVAAGIDGVSITDLDTGRVVHRPLDTTDPEGWQPVRLLGHSLVGSVDGGTMLIPLNASGPERFTPNNYPASLTGSPMWVSPFGKPTLQAIDESGRPVGHRVDLPPDVQLAGVGTGSLLLVTRSAPPAPGPNDTIPFNGADTATQVYLFRPGNPHLTRLSTNGCPPLAAITDRLVVMPAHDGCNPSTELEMFDLTGRLVHTVKFPAGEFSTTAPVCSPDGEHVAIVTSASTASDLQGSSTVRLLDLKTGSWTTVDASDGWLPQGWSADGTTLLLQLVENTPVNTTQQFGQLAYLRVGDPTLHSIRVLADAGNYFS